MSTFNYEAVFDYDTIGAWRRVRAECHITVGDWFVPRLHHTLAHAEGLEKSEGGIRLVYELLTRLSPWRKVEDRVDFSTAQYIGFFLSHDAKIQLLPAWLINITSSNVYQGTWLALILTISRDWLRANIQRYVEPLLDQADAKDDSEVYSWVELVLEAIDPSLLGPLFERAAKSAGPEIRAYRE